MEEPDWLVDAGAAAAVEDLAEEELADEEVAVLAEPELEDVEVETVDLGWSLVDVFDWAD